MAAKIALSYTLLGGLWILCSGWLLHHFVRDRSLEALLETFKGWFFVAVTAGMLWLALARYFREFRHSAQLLHESEERLRLALEAAQMGTFDWDMVRNHITWSRWHEQLWGFQPGEFDGTYEAFSQRVHAEDRAGIEKEIDRCIASHSPYRREFRVVWPDGSVHWIADAGEFTFGADGRPTRLRGTVREITGHKQAQEALRQSETRYRLLAENVEDFVAVLDAQENRLYVSPSFFRVTGWSAEEVMQSAWDARLHPEDIPLIKQTRAANLAGQTTVIEHRIRCRDGSWRWVESRCKPVPGSDGQEPQLLIWQHDITGRKRAEAAQQQSDAEFRAMFEVASIGMAQAEPHTGQMVRVNQKMCAITGYSAQEMLQLRVPDLTHPEDRQRDGELFQRVVRGEIPDYRLEKRYVRKDGAIAWVNVNMTLIRDAAGQPLRTMATIEDITERKRTEELLRESLMFRREAEKIGRIGAWKVSPKTDYLYWTEGVYAILEAPLDYKPGLAEGLKFYDAESIPVLREALIRALADGTPFVVETGITTTTGKHLWTEVRGLGRLGDDEQAFVMGTLQDITERKELETQLRQAQKLEAVGQLAGGVAHDFNNILAAIMMHLGLLHLNTNLDEETRHALKELDSQARRAAELTRQLLMFSRRSVLAVKPLDLNEVVANLLKMLQRLIGEQIDVRFDGKSALPSVEADEGMLEQVLMNLVVNARDAMPKGGKLTISTTLADVDIAHAAANPNRRAGRFVCLSVSDTGCGMDSAMLKRIFEPFFTTKQAGKGTGLGLATVHGIVAQHKGWVEVDSGVNVGSTFRVYLPAAAQARVEAAPALPVKPVRRGRETVLLVEDDLPVRQVVGRSLRALGYQVHEAANGQEAMTLWQTHGPQVDLLFTDMVMPEGMTGLELAEQLQALKPGLKVIISSGYSDEMVEAGVPTKTGMVYLPKPYATGVLANVIRDCLDPKK